MPPSSLPARRPLPARTGSLIAAALATLALVAGPLTPAAAAPDPAAEEMCLFIGFFDVGSGGGAGAIPVSTIQQGSELDLYWFFGAASAGGNPCESLGGLTVDSVPTLDGSDEVGIDIRVAIFENADDTNPLPPGGFLIRVGDEFVPFGASFAERIFSYFDEAEEKQTFSDAVTAPFVSNFQFAVTADAPTGDFLLTVEVFEGAVRDELFEGSDTLFFGVPIIITAPAGPTVPAGPTATLSCDTEAPVAGSTVTCELNADPEVDFLWRAFTNPDVADGVVTTGTDGVGTLSFVVPASAVGEELFVEVVEWLAPRSIGTVTGPVPTSVPAGDGSVPLPTWLLLLALVSTVAVVSRSARMIRT